MSVVEMIAEYGGWSWVVAGLVVLAIELLAPGGVLVWFGIAGVLTGIAALQVDMAWSLQMLVFLALSFGSVFVWRAYRKAKPDVSDRPFLNQRATRYLGQVHSLAEAVSDGEGQLILDGTIWRIRADSEEIAAGSKVKIVGADGTVLLVELS